MKGFVDLHCHWVAGIDDGARTVEEGLGILVGLKSLGFDHVIATPHMRPSLFDTTREELTAAYERMLPHLERSEGLPLVGLSSEHYFDVEIFNRLINGQGLPYPGGRAVLLEFYEMDFPPSVRQRLFDIHRTGLQPVIAHPERYRSLWEDPSKLEPLIDQGAVALLDAAALVGKYGRHPKKTAQRLLELGLYHAACSDAHRPSDLADVEGGIRFVEKRYGPSEVDFLFREGPCQILAGTTGT